MTLRAPFPYFGGKSRIAHEVWHRFGDVQNYVEPFCGSAAVLLARPTAPRVETINDANCFVANFWRAISAAPEAVAALVDWPINEADLHARHRWLMLSPSSQEWRERMKRDPEYYDAQVAAWWVWGACQWIGAGWCDGTRIYAEGNTSADGKIPRLDCANGVHRELSQQIPNLRGAAGAAGMGVHASALSQKMPNLSHSWGEPGVLREPDRRRPQLTNDRGVLAGHHGATQSATVGPVLEWFEQLRHRLRRVRVACGDWARVCTPAVTSGIGTTAVFLDPPYGEAANRTAKVYAIDSTDTAEAVRAWCAERGADTRMRIALCGYEGEHEALEAVGWTPFAWRTSGGYANQNQGGQGHANRLRERIWFSPHCLSGQAGLFEQEGKQAA